MHTNCLHVDPAQDSLDIPDLLTAEGTRQQELLALAREVRRRHQGDEVHLRAVIETGSLCQKNCGYCTMRAGNASLDRYAMEAEEIIALAVSVRDAGFGTVFLQGGQNPCSDDLLEEVIPVIKGELGLDVLLCLGERPKPVYQRFARLGADSYILKFETSDAGLYSRLTHSSLDRRLQCIDWIREAGMKLGTGNITGLPGQTLATVVDDIDLARKIHPDFVSCSPFTPGSNTPLSEYPSGDLSLTLNTMALYRILLPDALIPSVSALETLQPGGQRMGLDAGANVLTINFTPREKRDLYRIYTDKRFVVNLDHARQTIRNAGLRIRESSRR